MRASYSRLVSAIISSVGPTPILGTKTLLTLPARSSNSLRSCPRREE